VSNEAIFWRNNDHALYEHRAGADYYRQHWIKRTGRGHNRRNSRILYNHTRIHVRYRADYGRQHFFRRHDIER
jgi:hypothetical protein